MIRGSSKAVTQMSYYIKVHQLVKKLTSTSNENYEKKSSNELKKEKSTLAEVFMEGYTVDYARDFFKTWRKK